MNQSLAKMLLRTFLALAMVTALALPLPAQVPPDADYQTIETTHFRVTFGPGLESIARHAAARAEVARVRLAATLADPPAGTIDIVVADPFDYSNGAATPLPSNRIYIFAKPPVDLFALAYNDDWIDLIITHELAHIFHVDLTNEVGEAVRTVFGRVPLPWPVFPALGTPLWSIEGVAVDRESSLTGYGRVQGSWHDMIVRTAVLADRADPIDRVNGSTPIWPGDQRVYIYGSMFIDWLAETYGDSVPRALIRNTANSWLPPMLFFDRIGRRTVGMGFTEAYAAWQAHLVARYTALADSLRARGLTAPVVLTSHGREATQPRYSPDGRMIAYSAADGRNVRQTVALSHDDGSVLWRARRNSAGALAWLDERTLITSQFEIRDPYRVFSDLYVVNDDGAERRLTNGARLQDPDVARSDRAVVAVQNENGSTRLVLAALTAELQLSDVRALTPYDASRQWAHPRFSPDGTRIAAVRAQGGEYGIVVLDRSGRITQEVIADPALDAAPAWSPDGRFVIFHSDRSGIANLYAADVSTSPARLRQITNVLGGAFHPDVSLDGRWIAYSDYRADGFHIARIPFDTAAWRDPAPLTLLPEARATLPIDPDTVAGPTRAYSAWPTLAPRFWLPVAYSVDGVNTFIGITTFGADVLGRHAVSATAAVEPNRGRTSGVLQYDYRGFGNPVLSFAATRDWEDLGEIGPQGGRPVATLYEREDVLAASAAFVRPRARTSWAAELGGELVRRRRALEELQDDVVLADPLDHLYGAVARVGFTNARSPALAISREDGVSLSLRGRLRADGDDDRFEEGYTELVPYAAAYRSLPFGGFAHHVAAARVSALYRGGDGAVPVGIGGASGAAIVDGIDAGGSLLLPVRGVERTRGGTRGWSASAEYRFPLALVGRGYRFVPFFLDRVSGALFVDAGDAWCHGAAAQRFGLCDGRTEPSAPLVGAGAELGLDVGLFGFSSIRMRLGAAAPVSGAENDVQLYVRFGPSF